MNFLSGRNFLVEKDRYRALRLSIAKITLTTPLISKQKWKRPVCILNYGLSIAGSLEPQVGVEGLREKYVTILYRAGFHTRLETSRGSRIFFS